MNMMKTKFQRIFSLAMCLVVLGLMGCVSGGGDTPAKVIAASVSLALTDSVTGATLTNISTGNPTKVSATLRDTAGAVVPNTVVIFNTDATLAKMNPTTGTALTDASGVAVIQITPASQTAAGATTITATATIGSTPVSGSVGFGVIATSTGTTTGVSVTISNPSIRMGSPATVTASVKNATGAPVTNIVVTFSTNATLAVMTPTNGTALTNDKGVASIQIDPASSAAAGASTITATAIIDGSTFSDTKAFSVTATSIGVPGISIKLTDPNTTTGTAITNISMGSPAKVTATVMKASGPAANMVVTFSTTAALAVMTPSTGTALTNDNGEAYIYIAAANLTAAGATTISAIATVEGVPVSDSKGFSVSAANALLGDFTLGTNPLSPYATTSVSIPVTGVPLNTPVTINFTSICVGTGKATLPISVQTVNGVATATYTDKGCASTDTITASVAGLAQSKSTPLTVNSPGASSIQFVSATPSTIVLKGTGGAGLLESSLVRFRVVDSNNLPISSGVYVDFDLTTRTGGILLDGKTDAVVTKLTDANGEASVTVQSGTTPTAVWVNARLKATTLFTQSNQLRISTGRPAQDRFSLGVSKFNIEGLDIIGITTTVSIISSDRLGNPVPDGTAINFVSEGAQIQPSCATVGGTCSVIFTTANPVPANGRVTVVAYTLGEESFTDLYGDNTYHWTGAYGADPFNDLGDVFINNDENVDSNGNPTWNGNEQSISFFSNTLACVSGISTSPPAPSKPGTCDGLWGRAHVRQDTVIVLSGSRLGTIIFESADGTSFSMQGADQCSNSSKFDFTVADTNNNPLPAGTTITTSAPEALSTVTISPATVQNTNSAEGTKHTIGVSKPKTAAVVDPVTGQVTTPEHCVSLGTGANLTITFTTPAGVASTANVKITD